MLARTLSKQGEQSPRRCRRPASRRRVRRLRTERLEDRVVMAAEGEVFNLSRVIDSAGLAGSSLTAAIRWGDGTETPATVSAIPASGPLKVKIDYSLDSGFFSSQSRKDLLQLAADSIVSRFNDSFTGISPSVSEHKEWKATFRNPTTGAAVTRDNMQVAANEIIIFAGARNLPGDTRGEGGPGDYSFPATGQITCSTQQECDAILANILAFRDNVASRGQAGALQNPKTDFAIWGGSLAFDNADTDWYFNTDISGIQSSQVDFLSVATHEMAHVLGLLFNAEQANRSPWVNLSQTGKFTGKEATRLYGLGNVPLEPTSTPSHWKEAIQSNGRDVLMDPSIASGERTLLTPLDVAAFSDIGWQVDTSNVTVAGSHTYADNGSYDIEIVLKGANGEFVTTSSTTVTNVPPTLTVPVNQSMTIGQTLSLGNIGQISDPGFANTRVTPPTAESFSYTINWGDQSAEDTGTATIDRQGNTTQPTLASFDANHKYEATGTYTVTVRVTDDDNGTAQKTFTVVVSPKPKLTLALSRNAIAEDAGADAATLTITRSGPVMTTDQTVTLSSSDTSEATLPASVAIPAGQNSVTTRIAAVDDNLLDGDQTVSLSATALGSDSGSIDLRVTDRETITATFNVAAVREDAPADSLELTIRRSNTDTTEIVNVAVTGGDASRLVVASPIEIAAGQSSVLVRLTPVNDDLPQRLATLAYTFTAAGYVSGTASVDLIDDEPPKFQRESDRYDVNGVNGVTAADALEIIRQLNVRGDNPNLDPEIEDPEGTFVDVNGDYRVTALDALEIINELNRIQNAGVSGEEVAGPLDLITAEEVRRRDVALATMDSLLF